MMLYHRVSSFVNQKLPPSLHFSVNGFHFLRDGERDVKHRQEMAFCEPADHISPRKWRRNF